MNLAEPPGSIDHRAEATTYFPLVADRVVVGLAQYEEVDYVGHVMVSEKSKLRIS